MEKNLVRSGEGLTEREEERTIWDVKKPADSRSMIGWLSDLDDNLNSPWFANQEIIAKSQARFAELRENAKAAWKDTYGDQPYFENDKQTWLKKRASEGWFLKEICAYITIVERCTEMGRAWEAANRALILGELLTEFRLSEFWNEYAIFGKKERDRIEQSSNFRRGRTASDRLSEYKLIRPKCSTNKKAYKILAAQEPNTSWHTIKQDILKEKKRRSAD